MVALSALCFLLVGLVLYMLGWFLPVCKASLPLLSSLNTHTLHSEMVSNLLSQLSAEKELKAPEFNINRMF